MFKSTSVFNEFLMKIFDEKPTAANYIFKHVYSGWENRREVAPRVTYTDANKAAEEQGRIMYSRTREEDKVEEDDEEYDDDEEDWEYEDENDVYLRSRFFQSWLWTDVTLPSQPDRNG